MPEMASSVVQPTPTFENYMERTIPIETSDESNGNINNEGFTEVPPHSL
jgi:hypothetical protein